MPYSNLYWSCPFYKWDERLCVHCEGGSKIVFHDQTSASLYFREYCTHTKDWTRCSIAQSIKRFYEGKEAAEQ